MPRGRPFTKKNASEAGKRGAAKSAETRRAKRDARAVEARVARREAVTLALTEMQDAFAQFGKGEALAFLVSVFADDDYPLVQRIAAARIVIDADLRADENTTAPMDRWNAAMAIREVNENES